jgi:hypothetical protein
MHGVPFLQQQFGEIGTILSGDACDESDFTHVTSVYFSVLIQQLSRRHSGYNAIYMPQSIRICGTKEI